MDKLKMQSADKVQHNIERLKEILKDWLPDCITETRDTEGQLQLGIDFDLLKQELSTSLIEGTSERYELNWPGKKKAILNANTPINKTLRPCRKESIAFDTTENLFIEGDNLDVLKLLQKSYGSKIKII